MAPWREDWASSVPSLEVAKRREKRQEHLFSVSCESGTCGGDTGGHQADTTFKFCAFKLYLKWSL